MARGVVQKFAAAAGTSGWFGMCGVLSFYAWLTRNSPGVPDFGRALVMPIHRHGRIFYVQVWEQRLVLIGLAATLLMVLASALYGLTLDRPAFRARWGTGRLGTVAVALFVAVVVYMRWPLP